MDVLEASASPKPAKALGVGAIFRGAFSFPVLLAGLLASIALVAASQKLGDPDTFLHIAVGRDILATRAWPTTESYSFTAYGNDCLAYEWLGQVLMALVARVGGVRGLAILLVVFSTILVLLLYYYAHMRCSNAKAAFVACLFMLPLAIPFLSLRPQLLGFAFLIVTLICLERFRQGRGRALWVLPVVFLLWVNIHGAFIFGFMALGLYWASGLVEFRRGGVEARRWTQRQRRHLEFMCLLCLVAVTITPYGTRLAAAPLEIISHAPLGVGAIKEYQPLGVASPMSLKLTLVLLFAFLLAQLAYRHSYRLEEIGLVLIAAYGAFVHFRLMLLFIPAFLPLLAMLLTRWLPNYEALKDRYVLNAALMALLAAGLLKSFPSRQELEREMPNVYPQRAVEYLRQQPAPGPTLNPDVWGGYLVWALGPRHRVFIDTRTLPYEEGGVFGDYLQIMRVDGDTTLLLRKYGIKACLIEPKTPLATFLENSQDWKQAYRDNISVIFVRTESPTHDSGSVPTG